MSELLNICLSCGVCCDGSLIGFVQLDNDELPALRKLMDIEEVDNIGLFLHPCTKLGCDGCTIYSQRPRQCGKFKCGILKSIEKKELDFDSAIEVINVLKEKKIAIEKQLATLPFELHSPSFYFKILELKKLFLKDKSGLSLSQNNPELISNLKELDKLVTKNFGISFYEQ
ncbi:YkgJ family cysteine cluster protein [Prolixibacteraceae bacterium Z1-6]|uniref:YkgJ family cysteine cluster protein n=1 Tax=Draconibacterium aestuarii TaxID=2998507 RepID=A0A9X3FHX1_9BACT|nr:YkgJ family cysteine cluster protein [Prolixibacteraceae bacterium Z1-6]